MDKKENNGIVIIFAFFICIFWYLIIDDALKKMPTGKHDILVYYDQINQKINKGRNWQQYVFDNDFQLGDSYEANGQTYQKYGTYPKLDGSTIAFSMFQEFAWQHLGISEKQSKRFVFLNMTHTAYMLFVDRKGYQGSHQVHDNYEYTLYDENKSADLIVVTHPSDQELAYAVKHEVELIIEPVCFDAFVFITHVNNPVDSLTIEQVQKIYTGEITNWKEVGGNDKKIVAYQRERHSGSQTGMEQMVMKGIEMINPKSAKIVEGMGQLIDVVAEYENKSYSLGYTYLYYIQNLYKNPTIKVLSIEGVEPSDENIRSYSYPFAMNYYAIIHAEDKEEIGGKFLEWMLSDIGQRCIEQAGYIPLK